MLKIKFYGIYKKKKISLHRHFNENMNKNYVKVFWMKYFINYFIFTYKQIEIMNGITFRSATQ